MIRRKSVVVGAAGTMLVTLGAGPATGLVSTQCLGDAVTVEGTHGDDRLIGTPRDDVISAGRGWDVVAGRGGNDVICGRAGSDRVRGGRGNDRLSGGVDGTTTQPTTRYGDLLAGGGGDDALDGGGGRGSDRVTYVSSRRAVQVDLTAGTATGQGTDELVAVDGAIGSRFADTLFSHDFISVLHGRQGDDRLVGVGTLPILLGGDGDDRARLASAGIAVGGGGDDVLRVGSGLAHSSLYGASGADTLWARGSADVRAEGGRGDDEITTGAGDDTLSGQAGNDVLDGQAGSDRGRGGDGTDTCKQVEKSRGCEG